MTQIRGELGETLCICQTHMRFTCNVSGVKKPMFASKMLLCPCCTHQAVIQHQPHCTQWNVQMSALICDQGGQYRESCREGTEGKSLSMNPGTRGVKEVYLNLMHKVRGQPDKKVSVSLSAGEMVVLRRLSEVNVLPPVLQLEQSHGWSWYRACQTLSEYPLFCCCMTQSQKCVYKSAFCCDLHCADSVPSSVHAGHVNHTSTAAM